MKKYICIALTFIVLFGCKKENKSDAYGNFEAKEIIVSSEANGKLMSFLIEEGDALEANQIVGFVDTVLLSNQINQLLAQKKATATKLAGVSGQISVYKEQIKTLETEQKRLEKLILDKAAPQKSLDNINGQISVLESRIKATMTQNQSVQAEFEVIQEKIKLIQLQIERSNVKNPVSGRVLVKYVEENEFVATGKPLYKLADLNNMYLKAYVSGSQLPNIKIGEKVSVMIDSDQNGTESYDGEITWISNEAEFTPKIIQTKEERVNLVYAIKVLVKNDGSIKIGMPGEVVFGLEVSESRK